MFDVETEGLAVCPLIFIEPRNLSGHAQKVKHFLSNLQPPKSWRFNATNYDILSCQISQLQKLAVKTNTPIVTACQRPMSGKSNIIADMLNRSITHNFIYVNDLSLFCFNTV